MDRNSLGWNGFTWLKDDHCQISGLRQLNYSLRWDGILDKLNGDLGSIGSQVCDGHLMSMEYRDPFDYKTKPILSSVEYVLSQKENILKAATDITRYKRILVLFNLIKATSCTPMATDCLEANFYEIITSKVGGRVVLYCFHNFQPGATQTLVNALLANLESVAKSVFGSLNLRKCMKAMTLQQRLSLLTPTAQLAVLLSTDHSGSFVLEDCIRFRNLKTNQLILCKLRGQFLSLSMQKKGSNLVCALLECCENAADLILQEIMSTEEAPIKLAGHKYGSYIVEAGLKITKHRGSGLYWEMLNAIKPYMSTEKTLQSWKKIKEIIKEDM